MTMTVDCANCNSARIRVVLVGGKAPIENHESPWARHWRW